MTPQDLDRLFAPRGVAVVGASAREETPGEIVTSYLERHFQGSVVAVNPGGVVGFRGSVVPALADLESPVDLAIFATSAERVVEEFRRPGERRFGAAVVFSAGFADADADGVARQRELLDLAGATPVLGPNCLGFADARHGVLATFAKGAEEVDPGGRVAVLSGSGGLAAMMLEAASQRGIGIRSFYSCGNQLNVSLSDVMGHVVEDDDIDVVLLFVEGSSGVRRLADGIARARERDKTVICLLGGRSQAGALAATAHTGSIVGDAARAEALLWARGAVVVSSIQELLDVATLATSGLRVRRGGSVGVVTGSGGHGILLLDALDGSELKVASLSTETTDSLERALPSFASVGNPVDLTGQILADVPTVISTVETLGAAEEVDNVVICLGPIRAVGDRIVDLLGSAAERLRERTAFSWVAAQDPQIDALRDLGFAALPDPQRLAGAMDRLARAQEPREIQPEHVLLPETWDEDPWAILDAAGIPRAQARFCSLEADPAEAGHGFAFPVVAKLDSVALKHKTEMGGVVTGVDGMRDLGTALDTLREAAGRLDTEQPVRILVQEHVESGIELIVTGARDAELGGFVMVGLGGVYVEILSELVIAPTPIDDSAAAAMLERLSGGRLLSNQRGLSPAASQDLRAALVGMSNLIETDGGLEYIELNPVIATKSRAVAVDLISARHKE